jgi:hypothetical protein
MPTSLADSMLRMCIPAGGAGDEREHAGPPPSRYVEYKGVLGEARRRAMVASTGGPAACVMATSAG